MIEKSEVMEVQDRIEDLNIVSTILEMDGYFEEAREVIVAADKMQDLLERLRSEVANDG
jgi:vacuolar-type H+-ATPase subunit C/Vma6